MFMRLIFFSLSLHCFWTYSRPSLPLVFISSLMTLTPLVLISSSITTIHIKVLLRFHQYLLYTHFHQFRFLNWSTKIIVPLSKIRDKIIHGWDHCPRIRVSLKQYKALLNPQTLMPTNITLTSVSVSCHLFYMYMYPVYDIYGDHTYDKSLDKKGLRNLELRTEHLF